MEIDLNGLYMERYQRNQKTITQAQQQILNQSQITVIGCGGLGGFVIEGLARLGVGNICLVDYDVFETSNLNRQLFATETVMGKSKLFQAVERVKEVNHTIHVTGIEARLGENNAAELIAGSDLVIDGVDRIEVKILLEQICNQKGIPLVYGAIGGNFGQFAVSLPEAPIVKALYGQKQRDGIEKVLGNPYYTPCIIGGLMVKLAVDVLLGGDYSVHGFYFVDLESYIIDFISTERELRT